MNPILPAAHRGSLIQPAPVAPIAAQPPAFPSHVNAPWFHQAMAAHAAGAPMQRYREMTIDELLLENRIVFLVGEINYSSATRVIMSLLYLQSQKKGIDINLYINSHGGSVDDTLAIYDTMNFLGCDVAT